jgi:hypothetical protein
MNSRVKNLHFRKFSPIDREHPIYELVEGDTVLLDIGATDADEIEVALHEGGANKIFSHDELLQLLADGRRLVDPDLK